MSRFATAVMSKKDVGMMDQKLTRKLFERTIALLDKLNVCISRPAS